MSSKPLPLGLLRPQRSRHKPLTSVPYVHTNDADFDSQLILDPKQASASVSPVHSSDMSDAGDMDLDSPIAIDDPAALGNAANIAAVEQLDASLLNDAAAHDAGAAAKPSSAGAKGRASRKAAPKRRRAPTSKPAAAAKKAKPAAVAAAAASDDDGKEEKEQDDEEEDAAAEDEASKKLAKWSHDDDMSLLQAVHAFVNANRGQLPPPIRTTSSALCTPAWKKIAEVVPKVAGLKKDAAGKKCSGRYTSIRGSTKVRQAYNVSNADCLVG
jgi:hypothetical protein